MRKLSLYILCLVLLAGCQTGNVTTFWNRHSISVDNMDAAEKQFGAFAALAASAPEKDALAAMDALFDKLKEEPVAYYIYAEWMDGAFYDILSPCRSDVLYSKVVERLVADGIFSESEYAPFLQRLEWMQYNRKGAKALVPGRSHIDTRTLVLVVNLSCPACREALETLQSAPAWSDARKIAVGLGNGPQPTVPGWEYLFPENGTSLFDIHMSPVYYVVAADGTVEQSYTAAL